MQSPFKQVRAADTKDAWSGPLAGGPESMVPKNAVRLLGIPVFFAGVACVLFVGCATTLPPSTPGVTKNGPLSSQLWSMTFDSPIRQFQLTEGRTLLVGTSTGLSALNPATGGTLWRREDLQMVTTIPTTGLAFAYPRKPEANSPDFFVIDVATGETQWTSSQLQIKESYGAIFLPNANLFLMHAELVDKGPQFFGVGRDGKVLWTVEGLNERASNLEVVRRRHSWRESGGLGKTILGALSGVLDTDSTLILWPTKSGPGV